MTSDEILTATQFQDAGGVDDWRALALGASAWFSAPSHAIGAELVRRVAELAGSADLMPDMDLRAGGVHVRVGSSGSRGFTPDDVEMARAISTAARDLGLVGDPAALQTVQLAFDSVDKQSVMPFWRTVLDYQQVGDDDLVDPMRRDPSIWFQSQDQPRSLRNRIHIDVSRPHALIVEAAAAAEATGGRATHEGEYYATFADAEGNEVDLVPLAPEDEVGRGAETADWRALFGAMVFYPVESPVQAAELAAAVAGLADEGGLPLLVDIRPDGVTIDTGKDQWEDPRFEDLARRVQATARGMALTADTSRLRFVQIGIDAVDVPAVRDFWRAVLGYEYDPRPGVTDIFDPRRLNMPIFFQQMPATEEARRNQRNRIHVDVFVPDDQARSRIDAALVAGGRIAYDAEAPEWWTLADPEGNEIDIAVSAGREELWLAAGSASEESRTSVADPFGGRLPTSHERMTGLPWDASYHPGPAPWDRGQPQPAIVRVAAGGGFAGAVLDAGCGTGENALHVASLGLAVLGVDVAGTAIEIARAKAVERGIEAEFAVADAFGLEQVGHTFDTVLDCGLFHTFDEHEQPLYATSLASVTEHGGTLYVLCFSDEGIDVGPHPVSRDQLTAAFTPESGWNVVSIVPERVQTTFHDDHGAPAWLATIKRS